MALRFIEIFTPPDDTDVADEISNELYLDLWEEKTSDDDKIIRILADVEYTEKIMNIVSEYYDERDDYRIVLIPVVASIPRAPVTDEEEKETINREHSSNEDKVSRISKSEMFEEVKSMVSISWVYVTLTIMACVVAATGMVRDSPAIVIGAMVIAPILGPNVGLSLATTLGDKYLLKKSLQSIGIGFSLGLFFSVLLGVIIEVDASAHELASRTIVDYGDILLGISAGVAGVLSFTRGISAAVIGVMVAVALLPPLVATGLLLGSGSFEMALRSGLLTVTYVICFNLAGIVTLLLQGVRPTSWQEKRDSESYSPMAIVIWIVLLLIMAGMIYFIQ